MPNGICRCASKPSPSSFTRVQPFRIIRAYQCFGYRAGRSGPGKPTPTFRLEPQALQSRYQANNTLSWQRRRAPNAVVCLRNRKATRRRHKVMTMGTVLLGFRAPDSVRDALATVARRHRRSAAQQGVVYLIAGLRGDGVDLPDDGKAPGPDEPITDWVAPKRTRAVTKRRRGAK
jgi:hypothetical protein